MTQPRTGWRVLICLAVLILGFLLGAWVGSTRTPRTCARVPAGIVCWNNLNHTEWSRS